MTAQLVTDALIWRSGAEASRTVFCTIATNSQYTSEQFQRVMADRGITCSMIPAGKIAHAIENNGPPTSITSAGLTRSPSPLGVHFHADLGLGKNQRN